MAQLQPSRYDALICLMDSPPILDCSVTNIPAISGSPIQVVAALPRDTSKLVICDGIGAYVGLFAGPVGQEQLRCVIHGAQVYEIPLRLSYNDRISLKSLGSTAITTGTLCITFVA